MRRAPPAPVESSCVSSSSGAWVVVTLGRHSRSSRWQSMGLASGTPCAASIASGVIAQGRAGCGRDERLLFFSTLDFADTEHLIAFHESILCLITFFAKKAFDRLPRSLQLRRILSSMASEDVLTITLVTAGCWSGQARGPPFRRPPTSGLVERRWEQR